MDTTNLRNAFRVTPEVGDDGRPRSITLRPNPLYIFRVAEDEVRDYRGYYPAEIRYLEQMLATLNTGNFIGNTRNSQNRS